MYYKQPEIDFSANTLYDLNFNWLICPPHTPAREHIFIFMYARTAFGSKETLRDAAALISFQCSHSPANYILWLGVCFNSFSRPAREELKAAIEMLVCKPTDNESGPTAPNKTIMTIWSSLKSWWDGILFFISFSIKKWREISLVNFIANRRLYKNLQTFYAKFNLFLVNNADFLASLNYRRYFEKWACVILEPFPMNSRIDDSIIQSI